MSKFKHVPEVRNRNIMHIRLGPEHPSRVLVPTNGSLRKDGRGVMGVGVALQFKNRYPGIDTQLGAMLKEYGNRVQMIWDRIYAFPVKERWQDKGDLELIRRSAQELVAAVKYENKEIIWYLPTPGTGAGGLTFEEVLQVLLPEFDTPGAERIVLCENLVERYRDLERAFTRFAFPELEVTEADPEVPATDWVHEDPNDIPF